LPIDCLSRNLMKKNTITIGFLADHLDAIPALAKWFRDQWPDYFANRSEAEMQQDFLEDTSRNRLPSRLVAFESNELVGTIVLREPGTKMLPEYRPELGGLYVVETARGHGVGAELVQVGMNVAHQQGYQDVYATTIAAAGILERLGWEFVKTVNYPDGQVSLFRCKL
jgi:N-acetylglutamate synthase-like GNAT family acetyltransferase